LISQPPMPKGLPVPVDRRRLSNNERVSARSLVIASGARYRRLSIPNPRGPHRRAWQHRSADSGHGCERREQPRATPPQLGGPRYFARCCSPRILPLPRLPAPRAVSRCCNGAAAPAGLLSRLGRARFSKFPGAFLRRVRPGQRLKHHEHEVGVTSAHNWPVPGRVASTRMQARAGSMFCTLV
jgi:hypothetical protein